MHTSLSLLLLLVWLTILALCVGGLLWIARGRPNLLPTTLYLLYRLSLALRGARLALWRAVGSLRHHRASAPLGVATATNACLRAAKPLPTPTHRSPLYTHVAHPHVPQHATERHKAQLAAGGINIKIAVWLTTHVGTMQCAYVFLGIGIGSLIGIFTGNVVMAAIFGSLSSYVLQLVLLPILSVGQNVLSQHQEAQSDEQYKATMRTLHESDQVVHHLDAQDVELVKQTTELLTQTPMLHEALDLLHALAIAQGIQVTPRPNSSVRAASVPQAPIPLASHPATARARRARKPAAD